MCPFQAINLLSGYKFVRKDRNKFGDGIAFNFNDQLPSRIIKIENPSVIEILTLEIAIRKNKILAVRICKPLNVSETDITTSLETITGKLSRSYEKLIFMGDFNMTTSNPILSQFLDTFPLSL